MTSAFRRTVPAAAFALGALLLGSPFLRSARGQTLTVDLSSTIRGVTHAASGSLYGVTETLPADVNGLIAPLHPYVFNNPAADEQQPVGDAIVVAGRVAPIGAKVSIRLADWFKGFYTFTTMADWFDKIGQTVTRKLASGLTNYYGYEIWNEPQGTYASSNPLPFNQFWMQTFVQLRKLDPSAKLIGPSIAAYDGNYLNTFLSFCKANSCVPDIISWHELAGENLTADLQNYRALEKQLGIGPLPISINEYSGAADLTVEGQPGASAPMIAKFERFQVDSACISYWDVPHPGRLGSLLATDTAKNGGWWFYSWYGAMTGNMVETTPPTPASPSALDGFANLDATAGYASVLLGGTNTGTVTVVVKGFHAATFFGSNVHAVVEHTPFINRTTAVTATTTLST
ncbi:MAG TPA: beta-xylosidase, partial [Polyangia bacterium]|nr:beta-xylosidase [Polyangia bacterium]